MSRVAHLSGVEVLRCAKPDCGHGAPLDRHHRRHEAMWLGIWAHRRSREPVWRAFVSRYHEFREEDIVRICRRHHSEIHAIYDEIISADMAALGRPLSQYTWPQARRLMNKLSDRCSEWLVTVSPGMDPEVYEDIKRLRRRILKKKARKERRRRR